ncbi:MAG: hypothetical protein QOJ02_58 [Acidobacteriota bacterium]|nr:hypothetical protein [Acidobacteriota bacterium]
MTFQLMKFFENPNQFYVDAVNSEGYEKAEDEAD